MASRGGVSKNSDLVTVVSVQPSVGTNKQQQERETAGLVKRLDFNVGIGLNDTSRGGVSSNKKEEMNKAAPPHGELNLMNEENEGLKGLLSRVLSHKDLHKQLHALLQQQNNSKDNHEEHEPSDKEKENSKQGVDGGAVPPKQLVDPAPVAVGLPNGSSQSLSNNVEETSEELITSGAEIIEMQSPDQALEGSTNNKIRKRSVERSGVQSTTETPIKKVCVSAEAGSQATKVQRPTEEQSLIEIIHKENNHNPPPPAATNMTSTASEAVAMPVTGSMSSPNGLKNPNLSTWTVSPNSPSMVTTASASAPLPTATSDHIHASNPLKFQTPMPQFLLPFPNVGSHGVASPAPMHIQQVFGQMLSDQHSGQQLQQAQQPSLASLLTTATTAVTADPNFISALASVIGSIVGSAQTGNTTTNISIEWTNRNNNSCNTKNENLPKLPAA